MEPYWQSDKTDKLRRIKTVSKENGLFVEKAVQIHSSTCTVSKIPKQKGDFKKVRSKKQGGKSPMHYNLDSATGVRREQNIRSWCTLYSYCKKHKVEEKKGPLLTSHTEERCFS